MNVKFSNEPGLETELDTEQVSAAAPAAPFDPADLRRSRLVTARNSLTNTTARIRQSAVPSAQRSFSWVGDKLAPVIDRAQAHRALIAASLAAVFSVLVVLRRRRDVDPIINESIA